MSIFKLAASTIGLDISRSSIKMVQFKRDSLTRIAYKEIPVSIRKQDAEFSQFVSKSISSLLKESNFEGRNVSSNLTGPQEVNLLFFTLPRMDKKDLEGAVSMEVRKGASFPIEKSIYEFYAREVQYGEHQLRIISAISSRETVNSKIEVLQNANLLTLRLDIVGHAIENLLDSTGSLSEEQTSLFLDIGAGITTMNFFTGNAFQFSRELSFGTDDLVGSIAKPVVTPEGRINLSLEDAEAIKTEYGIIEDDSKEMIRGKIPASQLSAMMRPFVERLLREVSHSVNHFRRQFDAKVGKIFLYGGAARIKRLDEVLKQNLEVEVSKFDPFQKMIVQLPEKQKEVFENFRLDFVVAAGLALGQKRKFNMLPMQIKVLHKLTTVRTGIAVGLACFAITLLFSYLAVNASVKKYQDFIKTNESYLMPLEDKLKAMDKKDIWQEKVKARKDIIKQVGRQPIWHGVLKEISNIIPEGIVLETISLISRSEGGMGLNMVANLRSGEGALSDFLINLNRSPFFDNVVLKSRTVESGEIGFELECNLVY